jgi:hypothetical protein
MAKSFTAGTIQGKQATATVSLIPGATNTVKAKKEEDKPLSPCKVAIEGEEIVIRIPRAYLGWKTKSGKPGYFGMINTTLGGQSFKGQAMMYMP